MEPITEFVPDSPLERAHFKDLVSSYGKTFHTWQIERDNFPYGIPQLMMGFTQDGQLDEALVDARDRRLAVSGTPTWREFGKCGQIRLRFARPGTLEP